MFSGTVNAVVLSWILIDVGGSRKSKVADDRGLFAPLQPRTSWRYINDFTKFQFSADVGLHRSDNNVIWC